MTVEAMTWVFSHSETVGTHRLVMLAIADHHGEGGAWPSLQRIADMARVSKRTAQRAIDAAVELGELKVAYKSAPGGTNLYLLTALADVDILTRGHSDTATPVASDVDTATARHQREPKEPNTSTSLRSVEGATTARSELDPPKATPIDGVFELLYLVETGTPYTPGVSIVPNLRKRLNAAVAQARVGELDAARLEAAIQGWPVAMGDARITANGLVTNAQRCITAADGAAFSVPKRGASLIDRARRALDEMESRRPSQPELTS
jgi:hypothetical protein